MLGHYVSHGVHYVLCGGYVPDSTIYNLFGHVEATSQALSLGQSWNRTELTCFRLV